MANVTVETSVEIFYHDGHENEYWLSMTGELFGPYPSEEEAILAIGPCLLTLS